MCTNFFWSGLSVVFNLNYFSLDTEYYFNKEACLREWENYFSNPINDVKDYADKLLSDLKSLQMSPTVEDFTNQMKELQKSSVWNKCVDLQIRKQWFSISKVIKRQYSSRYTK